MAAAVLLGSNLRFQLRMLLRQLFQLTSREYGKPGVNIAEGKVSGLHTNKSGTTLCHRPRTQILLTVRLPTLCLSAIEMSQVEVPMTLTGR